MSKLKTKSALSYFGSDSEVAGELASMLHHCKHVTIPFCGGMAILPHLKARAVVANDANKLAINFYRVVSGIDGDVIDLRHRCEHTLSHPDELDRAQELIYQYDFEYVSETDLAWAYWALCWIGRKGKGGTKNQGGSPSVRWTPIGGTNASRIRSAANDLSEWARQFERCEWQCRDFRELLPKVTGTLETGIYCDPPWVGAGNNYLHSFSEGDHRDLELMLRRFELAKVVLRYGDDPLIRELYGDNSRWHIIEASSRDQCNATKGELWITN